MKTKVHYRLFLGIVLFLAASLLLFGSWFSYTSTFDTSTVGLMAVNIVQGERPLFFYGQPYFGALEAYLAALYVYLFGFSEFIVTLSPISFTLAWIVFTYLLFARIHNQEAGLVAAICVAFPGYYIFWYSVATYGGYPIVLCFGTAILWLSLRVVQERIRGKQLFVHLGGIGLLMGLGIWVHSLIFPFILLSSAMFALYIFRNRFRADILFSLALGASIALMGFLPAYSETGIFMAQGSDPINLTLKSAVNAIVNMFAVNCMELIVWNFAHNIEPRLLQFPARYTGLIALGFALPLALSSVFLNGKKEYRKMNYTIPLFFCLLFIGLYILHHLAIVKAPRYVITFLFMLVCMVWSLAIAGQKKPSWKKFSIFLFSVWIGYQLLGTVLFIRGSHAQARKEQDNIQEIVDEARKLKLKSVVTYDSDTSGFKAQKLSMFAENSIAFVNAGSERYQRNAQFAEIDLNRGYLSSKDYKIPVESTLSELGIEFTLSEVGGYFLFSGLKQRQRYKMQALPGDTIQPVAGEKESRRKFVNFLTNRNQDIFPELNDIAGQSVIFDTGEVRYLCGIWMFIFQNPGAEKWKKPGRYEVYVSKDAVNYNKVFSSVPHTRNGFYAGPTFYIGGPWIKMDGLFNPVRGRYVKIVFLEKNPVPVTEIVIFETDGELEREALQDVKKLTEIIKDQDIDFVLADRWMNASLREHFKGTLKANIAPERFGTKFKSRPLQYFIRPEKGNAVICARGVANECERILIREYGESVLAGRWDVENYTLFSLEDIENSKDVLHRNSALLWNGHLPLQTQDKDLIACWQKSYGVPVWRSVCTKTKGIYHDSWTNGKGVFQHLDYTIDHTKESELHIVTRGNFPWDNQMTSLQMEVVANKKIMLEYKRMEENVFVYSLPDNLNILKNLEVRSTTFIPGNKDARRLGIDIRRILIQ